MDRDQRSRSQKAARTPPHRSLGSRLGLQKKGTPPNKTQPRPARGPTGAIHTGRPAPQNQAPPGRRPPHQPASRPAQGGSTARRTAPPNGTRRPPQNNPQKPGYKPGAPRPQRRVTQAEMVRRRNRRRFLGVLAVFAVLVLGVVLSINLLFKVADFRIENADGTAPADLGPYTEQQLLDVLAIQEGDNLFGFSTAAKSKALGTALPYLDAATVEISLPGTVVVKVTPAVERFAVPYGNSWLVVSESGKILRNAGEYPDGLIWLEANLAPGLDASVGQSLRLGDADTSAATAESAASTAESTLYDLLEGLRTEALLDGVSMISMTDLSELNFLYQGRVSVKLGTANNLDYKLRLAAAAILDTEGKGLTATDRGTLDVSYQRSDGEIWAYFQSADPITEEPEASQEGDPAAEGGDPENDPAGETPEG